MEATSKILKTSPEDKKKALNVLNTIKDKPLLVRKMETINALFEKAVITLSPKS